MIDGSHLPYDKNVELTRQVVEYAHKYDVTVEGELGVLAGIEDEVSSAVTHYTKPAEVEDFVKKTGVDSLAISIGTSHGANKFKPEQCTRTADVSWCRRRFVLIFGRSGKTDSRISHCTSRCFLRTG